MSMNMNVNQNNKLNVNSERQRSNVEGHTNGNVSIEEWNVELEKALDNSIASLEMEMEGMKVSELEKQVVRDLLLGKITKEEVVRRIKEGSA